MDLNYLGENIMLEWIIIGVLTLVIVVLFFKKPKEIIKEIKVELDDSEIKEWNERKEQTRKEYYNLEQELAKNHQERVSEHVQKITKLNCDYDNTVKEKKIELNHFEEIEKNKILSKLDLENEKLRQNKIKEFKKFCEEKDEEIKDYEVEIQNYQNELQKLVQVRAAAIDSFKKESELKNLKITQQTKR
jgi:hypothetical protein